ncbi:hypothetical protein J4573_47320 [Actinomadura barringtoniae]|uniref:Uncharacterized protein n=1 Tax=Actinomadura barringtoniae TaxID=1427535 RepID=A0A939PU14_9ACTN|nr:hypothetical protein [Actinomadura barringtoniae]MBO2454771.1 hypothetical protein [Actinomadura barringtoniae]
MRDSLDPRADRYDPKVLTYRRFGKGGQSFGLIRLSDRDPMPDTAVANYPERNSTALQHFRDEFQILPCRIMRAEIVPYARGRQHRTGLARRAPAHFGQPTPHARLHQSAPHLDPDRSLS